LPQTAVPARCICDHFFEAFKESFAFWLVSVAVLGGAYPSGRVTPVVSPTEAGSTPFIVSTDDVFFVTELQPSAIISKEANKRFFIVFYKLQHKNFAV
jgi:hypothetical protein